MTPTATLVDGHPSLKLFFEVEGVEPRPVPYSRTPAMYQPETCTLQYSAGGHRADLYGVHIKKDGTPGSALHKELLWTRDDWPDWLWDLAVEHAPEWFTMPERAS